MDDLISRQAAIDAVHKEWDECLNYDGSGQDIAQYTEDALWRLPSAQQWIPVTERLPEEERKDYWICTDTGHQCECRWTNNCFGIGESDEWGWSIFDIPRYSHVVAWMPLPKPYRGDDHDEG